MKSCTRCKAEKPKAEFPKRKQSKDGLHPECRACVSIFQKKYRLANKDKIAENRRAWLKANPDKVASYAEKFNELHPGRRAEYQRRYQEANPEKVAAAIRLWSSKNAERISQTSKAWNQANQEKVNEYVRRRRARKMQVKGTHTAADVRAVYEKQRGLCANCGKKLFKSGKKKFHIDHIQPLAKGGSDDKYNLQCLCPGCNQRKHAKDPIDWAKENGRLL